MSEQGNANVTLEIEAIDIVEERAAVDVPARHRHDAADLEPDRARSLSHGTNPGPPCTERAAPRHRRDDPWCLRDDCRGRRRMWLSRRAGCDARRGQHQLVAHASRAAGTRASLGRLHPVGHGVSRSIRELRHCRGRGRSHVADAGYEASERTKHRRRLRAAPAALWAVRPSQCGRPLWWHARGRARRCRCRALMGCSSHGRNVHAGWYRHRTVTFSRSIGNAVNIARSDEQAVFAVGGRRGCAPARWRSRRMVSGMRGR